MLGELFTLVVTLHSIMKIISASFNILSTNILNVGQTGAQRGTVESKHPFYQKPVRETIFWKTKEYSAFILAYGK